MSLSIATALSVNNDNTTASITFSNSVYKSNGSSQLEYSDFGVTTTGTAVLDTNNCSVTRTNRTFTFTLAYSTIADNNDTLKLTGTVYRYANVYLDLSQKNNAVVSLNDITAPTITIDNSSLTLNTENTITIKSSEKLYFDDEELSEDNNPQVNDSGLNKLFTSEGKPKFSIDNGDTKTLIDSEITIIDSQTATFNFTPTSVNTKIYFTVNSLITDAGGNIITQSVIDLSNKIANNVPNNVPNNGAISTQSCFLEHTHVRTDQGYIQISKLDPSIHTIRNMKIKALIKSTLLDNKMVFIQKNALYNNVPCENTHMTTRHRLYYNKKYVNGDDLVNMQLASYESIPRNTHVYNVLLHNHDNMLINNMIVETQNPRAVIGKLYNNFLLNKSINKKTIACALKYVEIMSKENWNNMTLIENGACPKTMFVNYLVNTKKENKKQVQSIMKQLM